MTGRLAWKVNKDPPTGQSIETGQMSDTSLTVPCMMELPRRYYVTITVDRDGGNHPNPVEFAAAAGQVASARDSSVASAHMVSQIISTISMVAVDQSAAVAVALAVVSDALKRPMRHLPVDRTDVADFVVRRLVEPDVPMILSAARPVPQRRVYPRLARNGRAGELMVRHYLHPLLLCLASHGGGDVRAAGRVALHPLKQCLHYPRSVARSVHEVVMRQQWRAGQIPRWTSRVGLCWSRCSLSALLFSLPQALLSQRSARIARYLSGHPGSDSGPSLQAMERIRLP